MPSYNLFAILSKAISVILLMIIICLLSIFANHLKRVELINCYQTPIKLIQLMKMQKKKELSLVDQKLYYHLTLMIY